MKVIKEFPVSAQVFMKHIKDSIQHDLDVNSALKIKVIQGIEYDKEMSNRIGSKARVRVKIATLNDNIYQAEFFGNEGITKITYRCNPSDDENTLVTYCEEFVGETKMKQLNYKLMCWLYKRKNLKRVHLLLDAIEHHLLEENSDV